MYVSIERGMYGCEWRRWVVFRLGDPLMSVFHESLQAGISWDVDMEGAGCEQYTLPLEFLYCLYVTYYLFIMIFSFLRVVNRFESYWDLGDLIFMPVALRPGC